MMRPMDDDPEMAALAQMGDQMGRGRFMDALPPEEQDAIRIIISPDGSVQVEGGESVTPGEEEGQEMATGAGGPNAIRSAAGMDVEGDEPDSLNIDMDETELPPLRSR